MLEVRELSVDYKGINAVSALDISVAEGEIVVLFGPNGAGKSSTLKAVSGVVPKTSGVILFDGQILSSPGGFEAVRHGLVQVPEGRLIFESMTVLENLKIGGEVVDRRRRIDEVLELFPVLRDRLSCPAASLSGGQSQMLAICRALMSSPKMLMLDEPSLGLAPLIVKELFEMLANLRNEGMTILLVEQHLTEALSIADRGYVLESGRIIVEGSASELSTDENIKRAYLGI